MNTLILVIGNAMVFAAIFVDNYFTYAFLGDAEQVPNTMGLLVSGCMSIGLVIFLNDVMFMKVCSNNCF